jgi:hypothetical protein
MSDDDALGPDMHPLLGFLENATSSAAGQDPLERLLEGRLDPAEGPAGYDGLARLLAAATAPPTPEELAGEQAVLAQFRAVLHPPTLVPRSAPMTSKLLTIKAAAAALVAILSIGGVAAAATGLLPGQARPVADQAPSTTAAGSAAHGRGKAAVADLDRASQGLCQAWQAGQGSDQGARMEASAFQALTAAAGGANKVASYCAEVTAGGTGEHGQGRGSAVGPDATAAARAGLCRAWQAGQGTNNGSRADSVAFQALAAAAGGADNIAGYCADVTVGRAGDHGQDQGAPPSGSPPSTRPSPPSSGPPSGAGPGGHGQGGPPTTTG